MIILNLINLKRLVLNIIKTKSNVLIWYNKKRFHRGINTFYSELYGCQVIAKAFIFSYSNPFVREFILRALKGKTLELNLNNLIEGRIDLVCRCISNSLFVSNNVRRDVVIHIVLEGSGDPPRTVSFFGETIKRLGLDEKSIAIILKNALYIGKGLKLGEERDVQDGVKISKKSFEALIRERKNIYYLHTKGKDLREVKFSKDYVFVFGDYIGMPRKTEGLLDRLGAKRISLGEKMYFASHCITIVNYELDRLITVQ